jgi:hypothetical protein
MPKFNSNRIKEQRREKPTKRRISGPKLRARRDKNRSTWALIERLSGDN